MGRLFLFGLNYKACEARIQKHRYSISDNCAMTVLRGVTPKAVVFPQTCHETVSAQLSEICYLRL
jgi:hypothetical protein